MQESGGSRWGCSPFPFPLITPPPSFPCLPLSLTHSLTHTLTHSLPLAQVLDDAVKREQPWTNAAARPVTQAYLRTCFASEEQARQTLADFCSSGLDGEGVLVRAWVNGGTRLLSRSLSHTRALSYTHTHTHMLSLTLSLSHTRARSLSLSL